MVETLIWRVRCAFLQRAQDIGQLNTLYSIAESLQLPIGALETTINNGQAMAELQSDMKFKEQHNGNVGYRVIEANVLELLENPNDEASWC